MWALAAHPVAERAPASDRCLFPTPRAGAAWHLITGEYPPQRGGVSDYTATLARALRLAFFLTIPSTVGLIVLAQPIIRLLYQRGRFLPHDTFETASVLQFYTVGLAAYAGIKVLAPAFYAINKRHTPMFVSFLSIGANLLLNWIFTFQLGFGQRVGE